MVTGYLCRNWIQIYFLKLRYTRIVGNTLIIVHSDKKETYPIFLNNIRFIVLNVRLN